MSTQLIEALKNTSIYPHIATDIEVIETHLSWILLTGPFAYKIKKPLALGFQDFTTLEKRKQYCEWEVQFNQALAAQIYVEAVAIYGNPDKPSFSPEGPVLEYAVKMHEFQQEDLLRVYAEQNKLTKRHVESIASTLASFHQQAQMCPQDLPYGDPDEVFSPVIANFQALKTLEIAKPCLETLEHIEKWATTSFTELRALLKQRKASGFVRACHGDLHLGNIVMLKNEPVIFDCIEFNESFRFTDVMNDVAFFAMDLEKAGKFTLSNVFVNRYIELTQDYEGLTLLRFYQCYRAVVRAKVTALLLTQLDKTTKEAAHLQTQFMSFIKLAQSYTNDFKPEIMIMMGPSGSGKTLYSEELLAENAATIRLRSDWIRKQLYGVDTKAKSTPLEKEKLYTEQATQTLYQQLQKIASQVIESKHSVIIDATCLKEWQRALFHAVAVKHQVVFKIFLFICQIDVLEQRIIDRATHGDISDADLSVLAKQMDEAEPLNEMEEAVTTFIDAQIIDNLIDSKEVSSA